MMPQAIPQAMPQAMPQGGLTLSNVPVQDVIAQPVEDTVGVNAEAGIPLWMQLGLPRPAQPSTSPMPQDPGFNINTATNTFYKTLGERVASGQMTMDQARAAQAEMRALQLNPAMANRAAATEIAQRNLGVGQYAPRPQGLTLSNVPQLPQGGGMPPMPSQQLINAFSPRQPSGVDNSTFMAGDPNFRFGQTPQQMAPNAQAMAMGGLMRKYGGMC